MPTSPICLVKCATNYDFKDKRFNNSRITAWSMWTSGASRFYWQTSAVLDKQDHRGNM